MSVRSASSPDVMPGLDELPDPALALDTAGRIVQINALACALARYERQELIGAPIERIVRDAEPLRALLAAREPVLRTLLLEGRRADGVPFTLAASVAVRLDDEGGARALCLLRELNHEALAGEARLRLMRKTGERFEAEITAAPAHGPEGAVFGLVTTYRDVSDRRRQEAELARHACSDDLTGLLNRRAFDERLSEEVARARHEHRPLSVALLDLDDVKAINDAHGHPAGDRVLVATAKRLRAVARAADHLARVGGEEFAWILPGTDAIDAFEAAGRARHAIVDTPFGELGHVTMSVGLCELAVAGGAGELYRLADVALYEAKAQGRNCTVRHLPVA